MPETKKYREVKRLLRERAIAFSEKEKKDKGSHRARLLQSGAYFVLPYPGDSTEIGPEMLRAMIRRLNLPTDIFD